MRHQIVVHRVGLQDDRLALNEELVQRVAWPERCHVARGQHQRRARVGGGIGVGRRLALDERRLGDARLHPDLGGRLRERDAVERAVGEDLDAQPAVRRLAHRAGDGRLARFRDVAQRIAQQPHHAHERPDPAGELLPRLRRARRQTLGLARSRQPRLLRGHGVVDHLLQQVGARRGARLGPAGGVIGHEGDDRIELDAVERRELAGRAACVGGRRFTGRGHRSPGGGAHVALPLCRSYRPAWPSVPRPPLSRTGKPGLSPAPAVCRRWCSWSRRQEFCKE